MTVKDLIKEEIEYWLDDDNYEFSVSTVKTGFKDSLEMILKQYEKEIAEKDKEINSFKQQIDMAHYFNQNLSSEIEELKQQILFKEDFCVSFYCERKYEGGCIIEVDDLTEKEIIDCWNDEFIQKIIQLKDNSLYDKLPSKEDKTCI